VSEETLTCKTCRFFDARPAQESGLCRREPPRQTMSGWPETSPVDWCGEHALARAPEVPAAATVASLVAQVLQEPGGHEDAIAGALHRVVAHELHRWCASLGEHGALFARPFADLDAEHRCRAVENFEKFIDYLREALED